MFIKYKPFLIGELEFIKFLDLPSKNFLDGLVVASKSLFPSKIKFFIFDKELNFDDFEVKLDGKHNDVDFKKAMKYLCLLMGYDPHLSITNIDFDLYYCMKEIKNDLYGMNGGIRSLTMLSIQGYLSNNLAYGLSRLYRETFPSNNVGVPFPSNLYMILTSDENIISTLILTYCIPDHLKNLNSDCYIGNVGTLIKHQGHGFAKSLMIYAINNELQKGKRSFVLEVNHTTPIAYQLYLSLGFKHIDTYELHKVLLLTFI